MKLKTTMVLSSSFTTAVLYNADKIQGVMRLFKTSNTRPEATIYSLSNQFFFLGNNIEFFNETLEIIIKVNNNIFRVKLYIIHIRKSSNT